MDAATEKITRIYRDLAKHPSIAYASITSSHDCHVLELESGWSQRDLQRSQNISFIRKHVISDKCLDVVSTSGPTETKNQIWNKVSSSGKFRVIVQKIESSKDDDKYYFEVWTKTNKVINIDVSSLKKHGKVYENDGVFGALDWSKDETSILFMAEKKVPETKSFFDKKKDSDDDSKTVWGDQFVYKQDWGEQLVGKIHPVICVLDIKQENVSVIDCLPDNVSPSQPVWSPCGKNIVCTGWKHEPYKVGLIYCPNRPSQIYNINVEGRKFEVFGLEKKSVRCLRFSPDGSKLAFLENDEFGPHMRTARLKICNWNSKEIETIIDIVDKPATSAEFPGIYHMLKNSPLSERCWTNDSKHVIFSSSWRSKQEIVCVDIAQKNVKRLTDDESVGAWSVLDVFDDVIVASCSSCNQPPYLVVARFEDLKWKRLDPPSAKLPISWSVQQHHPVQENINSNFPDQDFESVLLLPTSDEFESKVPMIVWPHGGPHTVFSSDYQLYPSVACHLGFAVLFVNFRGSTGFGEDSIQSLLGNVGTQDVRDVIQATQEVTKNGKIDGGRLYLCGGSHGGFLVTHICGQYPDMFRSCVARNPVVNMATKFTISDIPDWNFVECGGTFEYGKYSTPEFLKELWSRSPVAHAHNIRIPILLLLGKEDRRVPPSQGLELYKILKARGVETKVFLYPDNNHPISKVDAEADAFVHMVQWYR